VRVVSVLNVLPCAGFVTRDRQYLHVLGQNEQAFYEKTEAESKGARH
jgi:hypothetical protein